MEIRQVGSDIESECVGCGETLLIVSGDSVNFRLGKVDTYQLEGFLCYECNKKENGDAKLIAQLHKLQCSECGNELDSDESFRMALGPDGNPIGIVCENCDEERLWNE